MPIDNLDFGIMIDVNGELLESAQMDLEFSNQFLPSPTRADIIARHLDAIRQQFPTMSNIRHRKKWVAGQLMLVKCKKPITECTKLINGSDYEPLTNVTSMISGDVYLLTFEKPYNPEKIGQIIENICEGLTEPNSVGGDGDNIEIDVFSEADAKYTFSIGRGDCPTNSIYKHFWRYSVTAQGQEFIVHLENEWERGSK